MGRKKDKRREKAIKKAQKFVAKWRSENPDFVPGTGAQLLREAIQNSTGSLREALIREGVFQ